MNRRRRRRRSDLRQWLRRWVMKNRRLLLLVLKPPSHHPMESLCSRSLEHHLLCLLRLLVYEWRHWITRRCPSVTHDMVVELAREREDGLAFVPLETMQDHVD